jgi:hypothetical protein
VLFGLDQPVFSGLIKITSVVKQKSKIVIIILLAYFFTIFDALVYPILTYSAEIWGFENKNIIEKMELQIKCWVFGTKLWVILISYLVKSTDYYLNYL